MLPCFNVRSIPATVSADELTAPNTALLTQISAHCFPPAVGSVPKLYVFVASGTMSLAISPFKTILSVSSSPSVMSPSAVMLPVACKLPVTFMLLSTSTVPVPLGASSRLAFELLVLITFPSMSMLSTRNLF